LNTKIKGFTLIELAVVTAIIGVLSLILMPSLIDVFESKRLDAEQASLTALEDDIKRSFQDSDWARNLAAFPALMPPTYVTQYATTFGVCPASAGATDAAWLVKLGRIRGITPEIGVPITADQQKSLYNLAYNAYDQPRWLIAAPTETRQQRYLVISVMAPNSKGLVVPANDGSIGWFDAIWNNNWENESGAIPTDWTTRLNPDAQLAWMSGRGSTTNCHRLVVKRIIQPKFTITVNNTHPTFNGWVDINGLSDQIVSAPGGAPTAATDILAGALVVFRRGLTAPGAEAYRIHLNDNTTFTVQP
jgi:prepilin-type N-terminal cleavage/methylation domain-containing protein